LVEYLVDHAAEHPAYVQALPLMHLDKFAEVLAMRHVTAEEIGVQKERLMRLYGPEALAREIGLERMVQIFGPREVLRTMGPEEVVRILGPEEVLRALGIDRAREALDRLSSSTDTLPERDTDQGHS